MLPRLPRGGRKGLVDYEVVSLPADLPKGAKAEAEYRFAYSIPGGRSLPADIALEVTIASLGGKGYYVVKEPPVDLDLKHRIEEAVAKTYSSMPGNEILAEDPLGFLLLGVKAAGPLLDATEAQIRTAGYYLSRDLMGYGLLDPYLRDPYIEDISCDGVGRNVRVWHSLRNEFDWLEGSLRFGTHESLDSAALRLANRSGAFVSAATPMVDATLPEGYRLSCTWRDEVSSFGSSFTVRKFRSKPFSITELIHMGTLSSDVAAFLWSLLELKGFVFIVGASASGKTTILNSLASLMNPNWKVVTIEDVREINLQNPGWKALHTRTGALSGFGRVGLFELVRLSLRERPDYVILGEARGEETSVLFQSASTGHGCMATFHATDEDALWARLTQPPLNIPLSLLSLIDAVVFVSRTPGVSARTVLRVSEYQDGWRTIFRRTGDIYEGGRDFAVKFWRRGEASNIGQARQAKDVDEKRAFLEERVREQVFSYEELATKLRDYYMARR
ncbi:MAG TPA: type II/IV secretion system ATPase subunit [Conexivisphaerales archaeon]|nr:type II/IV secretion system ATPase subunit [Conexivisphaerales archaeon]